MNHSTSPPTKSHAAGSFVVQLNEHDILLGRGTGPNENHGNIHFRETIKTVLREPGAMADDKSYKSRIAHKVVKNIKSKKGRFLRKLTKAEATAVSLVPGGRPWSDNPLYVVATNQVAIVKTRQALRFQLQKDAESPSVMTADTSQNDVQPIIELFSRHLLTSVGPEYGREKADQEALTHAARVRLLDPTFGVSVHRVIPGLGLPSSSVGSSDAFYNPMKTSVRTTPTMLQVVDPSINYLPLVQRPPVFDLVDVYRSIASRQLLEEKLFQLHYRRPPLMRLAPDQQEDELRLLLSRSRNRVQGHWMHYC